MNLANQIKESFTNGTQQPGGQPTPVSLPMPKVLPLINHRFRHIMENSEVKTSMLHPVVTLREVDQYSNAIFTSSYDEE